MKEQIKKLKEAKHQAKIGGIYHSTLFFKLERETKEMIINLKTDLVKPEYYNYNSIINWYNENKDVLDNA